MVKLSPTKKKFRRRKIRRIHIFYSQIALTLGKASEHKFLCLTCRYSRKSNNPNHKIYCKRFKILIKQKIVSCGQYKHFQ